MPGGSYAPGRGWLWTTYNAAADPHAGDYPLRAPIAKLLRKAMEFHSSAVSGGTVLTQFQQYQYFRMWPESERDEKFHATKLGEVYTAKQAEVIARETADKADDDDV